MATSRQKFKPILLATFIVGTLDGLAAVIVYRANPVALFQLIASGAVGRDVAFAGGIATTLLGVFFHYLIAFTWTWLFFSLFQRYEWMRFNKIVIGISYGLLVWVVMNLVVLRLSMLHAPIPPLNQVIKGALILIVAVGLPLSLMAARFFHARKTSDIGA